MGCFLQTSLWYKRKVNTWNLYSFLKAGVCSFFTGLQYVEIRQKRLKTYLPISSPVTNLHSNNVIILLWNSSSKSISTWWKKVLCYLHLCALLFPVSCWWALDVQFGVIHLEAGINMQPHSALWTFKCLLS